MSDQEAIRLPRFGEGVASAELISWLVEEGAELERGTEIAEVQTAKAVLTVEAPRAGTLDKRSAEIGQELSVGDVLGWMHCSDAATTTSEKATASETAPTSTSSVGSVAAGRSSLHSSATPPIARPSSNGAFLSPRVRARLGELGLEAQDLQSMAGSGRDGRVTAADVERFAEELTQWEGDAADPLRLAIADSMQRSWARPLATVARQLRLDPILAHRRSVAGRPAATVYAVRALATVLRSDHRLICRLVGGRLLHPRHLSIGLAVIDQEKGLRIPTLHDPDQGSLTELAERCRGSQEQARAGRGERPDPREQVASVTNYGSLGLTWGTPIPPAGQSCILGLGVVQMVPDWDPTTRSWQRMAALELTLTFDHRVADGGAAADLIHEVARLMEHPSELA